jgi:L-iditol 2-dehydrogenase
VIRTAGATPVLFGIESDEPVRLSAARGLGIRTVNLSRQSSKEALGEMGLDSFDHIVDCSGSTAALESGLDVLKKGGKLTLVGLFPSVSTLDFSIIVRREIKMVGSYASKKENYTRAIELLAANLIAVDVLVTHYPLDEHDKAFQDALAKKVVKPVFVLA